MAPRNYLDLEGNHKETAVKIVPLGSFSLPGPGLSQPSGFVFPGTPWHLVPEWASEPLIHQVWEYPSASLTEVGLWNDQFPVKPHQPLTGYSPLTPNGSFPTSFVQPRPQFLGYSSRGSTARVPVGICYFWFHTVPPLCGVCLSHLSVAKTILTFLYKTVNTPHVPIRKSQRVWLMTHV